MARLKEDSEQNIKQECVLDVLEFKSLPCDRKVRLFKSLPCDRKVRLRKFCF